MHALLLTVIVLGGGQASVGDYPNTDTAAAADVATVDYQQVGHTCSSCGGGHLRGHFGLGAGGPAKMSGTGMPQTCYSPRYGCYYSNNRHMNRYPAFHGTFYRRPYNYRDYFDYPWHAEMHEPTSMFSFNVVREQVTEERDLPPLPPAARVPGPPSRSVLLPPTNMRR